MAVNWPEERYSFDAIIQDCDVPIAVNANDKHSVITTGLLELLNTEECYIKFQRKFIVLSELSIESLGRIKNLAIELKHVSIKPTLCIIKDDYPCLIFGQDCYKRYQIQYNITKTKLRFRCQNRYVYIPIIKIEDYDEVSISDDEEKELFINTKRNPTKVKEGFLIDLSENSVTSQLKDKSLISSDLFELDVEEFQRIFNQKPLKNDNSLCTTNDYISEIMYDNDFLISETFDLNSKKLVESCNYKDTVSDSGNEIQQQLIQQKEVSEKFIPQRFQAKVKKKRCFLCDQLNHMMNECLLLSEFRKHETYCKKNNIHVWKSWEEVKALYYNAAKINNKRKSQKLKKKEFYYFVPDESYKLQNMEGKILHENINGTLFKPYKDRQYRTNFGNRS